MDQKYDLTRDLKIEISGSKCTTAKWVKMGPDPNVTKTIISLQLHPI